MNAKLILALVLAFALTGCNGKVPATVEPTAVIPTEVPPTAVPSPTPTLEPTALPTEVTTPTATSELMVWEIAETMLAECAGSPDSRTTALTTEAFEAYFGQLLNAIVSEYPVVNDPRWAGAGIDIVFANDGIEPSPFAHLDYTRGSTPVVDANCGVYVIFYEDVPENGDGDGILVGKAYLFYEVGGTQPNVLDGELREVHFVFPLVQ